MSFYHGKINRKEQTIELYFYFDFFFFHIRFPFYYWIKIFIVLWMNSPTGATLLYKRFVQPVLKEREQVFRWTFIESYIDIFSYVLGNRWINWTNKAERIYNIVWLNYEKFALCINCILKYCCFGEIVSIYTRWEIINITFNNRVKHI